MGTAHTTVVEIDNTDPPIPDGPVGSKDTWTRVLNARGYARGATWGALTWSGAFSVDTGGTSTVFAVRVGIIQSATLRDSSSVWRPYFTSAETVLDLTDVESAPGNLTGSTWYYVYIYSDGTTTPAFQISTSPPTESGAPTLSTGYKRGQVANYRYLGCFPTLASGAPVALRACDGVYRYRRSAGAVADLRVLNAQSATSNTAVACAALVPPHSRLATIRAALVCGDVLYNEGYLRTNGDSGADEFTMWTPSIVSDLAAAVVDVETDASQNIAYRVENASLDMTLFVDGFYGGR